MMIPGNKYTDSLRKFALYILIYVVGRNIGLGVGTGIDRDGGLGVDAVVGTDGGLGVAAGIDRDG